MASTTLRVHNLHCPSCVSHLTTLLSAAPLLLDPNYIAVSPTTGLVSFRPHNDVDLKNVKQTLQEGGFQVEPAPPALSHSSTPRCHAPSKLRGNVRSQAGTRFTPSTQLQANGIGYLGEQKRRDLVHKQTCQACRDELPASTPHLGGDRHGSAKECVVPVTRASHVFKSTFIIGGMTCASCVNGLTSAFSQGDGIKSTQVTLLPNRAIFVHDELTRSANNIKSMIEDAGYDAELVESIPCTEEGRERLEVDETAALGGWRESTFVIEGMTCASCVGALSDVFETATPGLRSAKVTLLPALAKVVHDPNTLSSDRVIAMIEDCGYGATLLISSAVRPKAASGSVTDEKQVRSVKLSVSGISCDKCSSAINAHLEALVASGTVLNFDPCSVFSPILRLTYTPQPPLGFTLRTLRSSILSLGPFTLQAVHTSSVLSLVARQAHARESKAVLLRLLITIAFAIPAFIIGIVFMSLLPSSHVIRQYFEAPLWGSASRAMIALFILATPVQFGVGMFFYLRAWHGLRGVWKHGGWKQKVMRWGSMDTLVALGTTGGYAASIAFLAIEVGQEPSGMDGKTEMGYFDSSIFLIMFILLGRYLEGISRQRTGDAIDALADMKVATGLLFVGAIDSRSSKDGCDVVDINKQPTYAGRLEPGSSPTTEELEVDYFEIGDVLFVPVGSCVPLDATLLPTSTSSTFDESSLTGEALPVVKKPGDPVFAGTTNSGPSAVLVRATSNAGSTMLDGIVQVVRDAMAKKAAIERLADAVTGVFVPVIVGIAALTFVVWIIRGYTGGLTPTWLGKAELNSGGWSLFAVQFAVSVLVVACPCGIGLAAPTAQMVGTGMAARLGIVPFGGGEAFQTATEIEAVCFDKTGTLTNGDFTVTRSRFFQDNAPELDWYTSLRVTEVVEAASNHPVSLGVQTFCRDQTSDTVGRAGDSASLISAQEIAGRGLKSIVRIGSSTFEVLVGNTSLLSDHFLTLDSDITLQSNSWASEGCSIILVAIRPMDTSEPNPNAFGLLAAFAVQDQPRAEAAFVISALEKRGIAVFLCTGDNERTAKAVARSVGIADHCVFAQVLPIDKAKVVKRLQTGYARKRLEELRKERGQRWFSRYRSTSRTTAVKVVFVGDGINDVVALTQSDVGISMGTGSSVALSSSEFCLLSSNLSAILTLLALAKATFDKILTNFVWACLFNACLIPIAAGAFYDLNRTRLPPVWAALAMALSSISVVLNSLLLRWTFRVPPDVRELAKQI